MTSSLSRRRFIQRSALAAGAAAGAGSLLELGRTGSAEAASARNANTLTIMYNKGEFSDLQVKAFESAHSGVTVKRLEYDPVALSAMLSAGRSPDVVRTTGLTIPTYIGRGVVEDLTDRFKTSKVLQTGDLLAVNDLYRWDGKAQGRGPIYGMVKDWSQDGTLWYNKLLFDKAKLPYPNATTPMSYDEMLAIAKKLTVKKGGHTLTYGLSAPTWSVVGELLQGMAQQGVSLFSADFTTADFTTPAALKVLKFWADYGQSGVGDSFINPATDATFFSGNCGMTLLGYWYHGNIVANNPKLLPHVGFAPAPQLGTKRISACQSGTGGFLSSQSKNKDLAWQWFEWFFGGQPAVDRATSGWGLPGLKHLFNQIPHTTSFDQAVYKVVQSDLPYQQIVHLSPYISQDALQAALTKYLTPVMKGQGSLNQAAKDLTAEVNKTLKQGKSLIG